MMQFSVKQDFQQQQQQKVCIWFYSFGNWLDGEKCLYMQIVTVSITRGLGDITRERKAEPVITFWYKITKANHFSSNEIMCIDESFTIKPWTCFKKINK